MEIDFQILDPRWGSEWPLPAPETPGSAAIDLRAAIKDDLQLKAGASVLVPTGLAMHLRDIGYAGQILPRSGQGHKRGLVLGNLVGLIDSDYQGELLVSCWNRGESALSIAPGERIAQLIVVPVVRIEPKYVTSFEPSARGKGGYGHTGQ